MGQFEGLQKGLDRFPGFDPVAICFDDPQFIWSRCHREANLLELDGMNGRGRWNHSGRTRYIRRRRGIIIAGMSGFHGTKRNWHSEHEKQGSSEAYSAIKTYHDATTVQEEINV